MDRQLRWCLHLDSDPQLVGVHARCGQPNVKQFSHRRLLNREWPFSSVFVEVRIVFQSGPQSSTVTPCIGSLVPKTRAFPASVRLTDVSFCTTSSVECPIPVARVRTNPSRTACLRLLMALSHTVKGPSGNFYFPYRFRNHMFAR